MTSKVYFSKIEDSDLENLSVKAKKLLSIFVENEKIVLQEKLPIKIHPGAIGNNAYLKPEVYTGIIEFLSNRSVNPFFVETCMSDENSSGKLKEFKDHGFSEIPIVIADGDGGNEQREVSISKGKHFSECLIAEKLANTNQVLVVTHFKGHGMAGFGGAIKMLGIGFASGLGKVVVHSNNSKYTAGMTIDWDKSTKSENKNEFNIHDWNPDVVSMGTNFRERVAEYASAATKDKNNVYLTFAVNFSPDCDCIGKEMTPVYKDLGIFVSIDPVAIDKAVYDLLEKREGKTPFEGVEIFEYAQSLDLGSVNYQIIEV